MFDSFADRLLTSDPCYQCSGPELGWVCVCVCVCVQINSRINLEEQIRVDNTYFRSFAFLMKSFKNSTGKLPNWTFQIPPKRRLSPGLMFTLSGAFGIYDKKTKLCGGHGVHYTSIFCI